MVYLKSVENVITLGKLIDLLFLFCLPLLSILFLKIKWNDLARPVMGTIFLVYICVCLSCTVRSFVELVKFVFTIRSHRLLEWPYLPRPSRGIFWAATAARQSK